MTIAAGTGVEIRSYRDSDADGVSALFAETHRLDPTVQPVSPEEWRSFTRLPFNREARDFAVAVAGPAVAAVLTSTVTSGPDGPGSIRHFRIVVHPEVRRRGIGSTLLARVEPDAARGLTLQSNCPEAWAEGRRFLERRGFEPVETDLAMARTAPSSPPPLPIDIDGIMIRPYAGPADHPAWASIHNDAYNHDLSYFELTSDQIAPFAARDGFGLWLAESAADGATLGFCWTIRDGESAEIESLAVRPAHQGRGIGRALIATALRELDAAGSGRIELSVFEENAPALRLYRSLGFEITSRTYRYWRRPAGLEGAR